MSVRDLLQAQQYRPKDTTASAVWVPKGIQYDVTVVFARPVPKTDDGGKVVGQQLKIRGLVNVEAKGYKPTLDEWVTYLPGSEVNIYVDAGKKTDALIAALDAAGLQDLPPLSRLLIAQQGELPPNKAGQSPTKLYVAAVYGLGTPEQQQVPYLADAAQRAAEEEAEESKRQAAEASMGGVPQSMASQPAPAPLTPAPLTPAVAPAAAPAAPLTPVATAAAPVADPAQPTLAKLLG